MTIATTTRRAAGFLGAAAVSLVAGTTLAVPARAAQRFDYDDDREDTMTGQSAADIRSVAYEVRAPKSGERPHLVVTMVLAAPPEPGMDYQTTSDGTCGGISTAYGPIAALTVAPGTSRSNVYFGCDGELITRTAVPDDVSGTTIRWSVPLDRLPGKLRTGSLYGFNAFTQYAEPVLGHIGPGSYGLPLDRARSYASWSIG
ncbi:MAG TPA: hypothetical protein VM030_05445 [Acidimicrobiales bacterium]|nr:hypothetical protein [Acidimicrobiales bacterium]